MKPEFPFASESFKKLNPSLFSDGVRRVETKVSESDQGREGQDRKLEPRKESLAFRVSLVVLSRRAMDSHDNLPFSCKPLADAIAESLGLPDKDIQWEYGWAHTKGQQGVMVKIEGAAQQTPPTKKNNLCEINV